MKQYNNGVILPQFQLSSPNVNNSLALSNISYVSKFKNRKNHEKENRRMTLELVKYQYKIDFIKI